jgi:hypothetical protein
MSSNGRRVVWYRAQEYAYYLLVRSVDFDVQACRLVLYRFR